MSRAVITGAGERLAEALLSLLSHDLRSPLGPVILATSAIEEDDAAGPDARELAGMAGAHAARAARLIDAALAAARGPRSPSAHVLELWPLLEDALEIYRGVGGDGRVEGDDCRVRVDRDQVRDVLVNLFEVAGDGGRPVTVRTTRDGAIVRIAVGGDATSACAAALLADAPSDWRAALALGARAVLGVNGGSVRATDDGLVIELEVAS